VDKDYNVMKIPDKINIIGREVKVVLDKKMKDYGLAMYDKDTIKIGNVTKQEQIVTLIHECLHYYDNALGWNFSEKVINQISESVYQIWRQV
jgi:hypothetical protein